MKSTVLIAAAALLYVPAISQQTYFITDPESTFKQAKEYYQKDNFSLAYPLLKELQSGLREKDFTGKALDYTEINYYTIACGLKQNDSTAVREAREFVSSADNESRSEMMSFQLAEYYFRKNDIATALPLYEKTSIDNLSNREIADLKFHQGYAYLTQNKLDKALPLMDAIRQMPKDPNYYDANYYYGFIAFHNKHYPDALGAFRIVEDRPKYDRIVPYYIANIYLVQNQKEKAIEYAAAKIAKGGQYYESELRQLAGHGYYEEKEFAKALPYLEQYSRQAKEVSREDIYELAYCHYQLGNWNKAITGFKQLDGNDSLAQNAMYLLGDAYLKTGQKSNARNAFLFCASNSSNPEQREIATFNYAKLSYELGYQDVALKGLKQYLKDYPSGKSAAEAKELLLAVLANTNNYSEALTLMDSLQGPSGSAKHLQARILYGRATELINDGMLISANELLDKALKSQGDPSVMPYINFWKGEISYRLNKLDDAIRYFFAYLATPASNGEVSPTNANYSLGYCFLKKENYRQAQGFFEKVAKTPRINAPALEQDAYIRDADCYYMDRAFSTALSMYNKVLDYSWASSDYATIQKAMVVGVNNGSEKINLLNGLIRKYPTSSLVGDANMEIANTYLANEQFREAIPYLKNVINAQGNEALKPRAYLRAGIAWYNLDNNKEALNQYNALLKQFPNSPEAQDALDNAKTVYVEEGRSEEYLNFAKNLGVEVSASQEDQLAYQEAEVQFNNGNFPAAAAKFEEYLKKFPDGKYALESNFYKSEIYFNQKDWNKAAPGYQAVADKVPNKFGEKALLQAARINFFYLKDYATAEKYFTKLKDFASSPENKMEAMRGLLRSQFELQQWTEAVDNANDLLGQKGLSTEDKLLANLTIAKSFQAKNQCDAAIPYYRAVASLSKAAYGAEARYQVAFCLFGENQLKEAEKMAFEVINKTGSYELWVTKAYLLLGDIYLREKDYFNAKATFQSVANNGKEEDIRQEARKKLEEVVAEEKKEGGPSPQQ
jgi:TolA-binding protein